MTVDLRSCFSVAESLCVPLYTIFVHLPPAAGDSEALHDPAREERQRVCCSATKHDAANRKTGSCWLYQHCEQGKISSDMDLQVLSFFLLGKWASNLTVIHVTVLCLSHGLRWSVRRRRWAELWGVMLMTWTLVLCTAWQRWSETSSSSRRATKVFISSWRATITRWAE